MLHECRIIDRFERNRIERSICKEYLKLYDTISFLDSIMNVNFILAYQEKMTISRTFQKQTKKFTCADKFIAIKYMFLYSMVHPYKQHVSYIVRNPCHCTAWTNAYFYGCYPSLFSSNSLLLKVQHFKQFGMHSRNHFFSAAFYVHQIGRTDHCRNEMLSEWDHHFN